MPSFQCFIFFESVDKGELKIIHANYQKLTLYSYFIKIIKGPGNSFQSQVLVIRYKGFNRNKHKRNFHYAAMSMMTSWILKFVDFTKTQKSRYLKNEALFFLQINKFVNYTSRATLGQKILL